MLSLQQALADEPRSSQEFSQLVVVSGAVPLGQAPLLDACGQYGDAEKPRVSPAAVAIAA